MRPLHFLAIFASALSGAASLLGCGCDGVQCGACSGVPITVVVTDADTGEAIEDAIVTIGGKECPRTEFQGPGSYGCDVPVGSYTVTVAAPGHAEATQGVTLAEEEDESCCSCGPQASAAVALKAAP
ncbi:MAG: carboxypeptidase regulatory-like domain-containing protein [Polyangiaceae bacterium]|nr:carboxypeptidase regulatory-like domain-containing protein [Polyangiaceae bacterium]